MTHDHKRNGTTTLFAALNTLDGTVVGRCMPRHTHKEFLRFLTPSSARSRPARWSTPFSTTMAPTSIRRCGSGWLITRAAFHFTPTSASWIDAVEGLFSAITRRHIRRGVFQSAPDLRSAINRYIRNHNRAAKPLV